VRTPGDAGCWVPVPVHGAPTRPMVIDDMATSRPTSGTPCVLIAHPHTELYGSDRVLLDTVVAMVRRGWRVVVTLPDRGPLADELEKTGAELVICPTPVLRKGLLRPAGFLRLTLLTLRSIGPGLRLIRRQRPDVVYVSTVVIPMWTVLARLARRPSVCHVHEAETGVPKVVRIVLAAPQLLASSIVANSEFSLRVLTEAIPALGRRTQVVLNPVPGPPSVTDGRAVLTPPIRLLYIGRLSPRKGPHLAIAALAELRQRGIDTRLDLLGAVFPGYEWYEAELRADITRLDVTDEVDFLGFRPEVWPWLAASDVVLVPSTVDEPFGNTAVEAVLAARPVVASRSGGLPEAVQGYASAVLVPANDAAAIADAVERLAGEWSDVVASARHDADVAASRHSAERYGSDIEEILGSVAAGSGRRHR
jgi:glycosyltransferase involved in cell wall biosynthesis